MTRKFRQGVSNQYEMEIRRINPAHKKIKSSAPTDFEHRREDSFSHNHWLDSCRRINESFHELSMLDFQPSKHSKQCHPPSRAPTAHTVNAELQVDIN